MCITGTPVRHIGKLWRLKMQLWRPESVRWRLYFLVCRIHWYRYFFGDIFLQSGLDFYSSVRTLQTVSVCCIFVSRSSTLSKRIRILASNPATRSVSCSIFSMKAGCLSLRGGGPWLSARGGSVRLCEKWLGAGLELCCCLHNFGVIRLLWLPPHYGHLIADRNSSALDCWSLHHSCRALWSSLSPLYNNLICCKTSLWHTLMANESTHVLNSRAAILTHLADHRVIL